MKNLITSTDLTFTKTNCNCGIVPSSRKNNKSIQITHNTKKRKNKSLKQIPKTNP
jgi:hypothetical protein